MSKILFFLITPIIWITGLLLLAVFSRNKKRQLIALIAGTMLLLIFTNSFILDEVMRKWEIPTVKNNELETYDVGIVLGGMSSYDKDFGRINFQQGIDRLLQAIDLYKKGKIKKIFISGGSGSMVYKEDREAAYLKPYLINLQIPESDILIEAESKNTRENALFTAEVLKKIYPQGAKYLLITSAFHMRRSILCFEKVGLKVAPFTTDRFSGKRKFYFDHLFIPNTQTLVGWDVLIHELMGFATYKISGYI